MGPLPSFARSNLTLIFVSKGLQGPVKVWVGWDSASPLALRFDEPRTWEGLKITSLLYFRVLVDNRVFFVHTSVMQKVWEGSM